MASARHSPGRPLSPISPGEFLTKPLNPEE
jgi:hypothetical protein